MSIQTELTRITNAKAAIKTAIEGKGVTVPDGTLLDGMAALIQGISAGAEYPSYITDVNFGKFTVPSNAERTVTIPASSKSSTLFALVIGIYYGTITNDDVFAAYYINMQLSQKSKASGVLYGTSTQSCTVTVSDGEVSITSGYPKWPTGKQFKYVAIWR